MSKSPKKTSDETPMEAIVDRKESEEVAPEPWDPARYTISQDFDADLGVKKELRAISIQKPNRESWVRTHPNPEYHFRTFVIELKEDRETYLVEPELWSEVNEDATFSAREFFTSMTRHGVVFLWPIRLPSPDGKWDNWNRSAMDAANFAKDKWIRVSSNLHAGRYEIVTSTAEIPDPVWPEKPFGELLKLAFQDFRIDTFDHPVLKRLRGEL